MKYSHGISNDISLEEISSLSHSIVFLCLNWSLRKAFLFLLAVLWNSAFRCLYLSFSPLLFTSLLFTEDCAAIHGVAKSRTRLSDSSNLIWSVRTQAWAVATPHKQGREELPPLPRPGAAAGIKKIPKLPNFKENGVRILFIRNYLIHSKIYIATPLEQLFKLQGIGIIFATKSSITH